MSGGLAPFAAEGLKILPELAGDRLRISLSGTIAVRDPATLLNPFFDALEEEAVRSGVATVEADLRGLSFVNSSAIGTLVRWVMRLLARPEGTGYSLVLVYDRKVSWQRINVPMMATIAPAVVSATSD